MFASKPLIGPEAIASTGNMGRRADVVQILSDDDAIVRLVGTPLLEGNEEPAAR